MPSRLESQEFIVGAGEGFALPGRGFRASGWGQRRRLPIEEPGLVELGAPGRKPDGEGIAIPPALLPARRAHQDLALAEEFVVQAAVDDGTFCDVGGSVQEGWQARTWGRSTPGQSRPPVLACLFGGHSQEVGTESAARGGGDQHQGAHPAPRPGQAQVVTANQSSVTVADQVHLGCARARDHPLDFPCQLAGGQAHEIPVFNFRVVEGEHVPARPVVALDQLP